MENQREIPRIGIKNVILILVGLALTVPLLITFDFKSAAERIAEIGIVPIILAFASIHIGVLFYILGWYFLLGRRVPFREAFLIGWVSLFVSLLIPTASTSGEIARIYLVSKRDSISPAEALSSIIVHRIVMIVPFIVSITLGFSYLMSFAFKGDATVILLPIIILALVFYIIYKISLREDYIERAISIVERALRRNLENGRKMAREYVSSFKYLISNKSILSITMTCAFLNWFFDMLPIFIYFHALGHNLNPLLGVLIYSVSIILILIPIGIPGNVGIREWVMTALLTTIGLSSGEALAITLTSSTITVFLNELFFGLLAYVILLSSPSPSKSFN